MDLIFKTFAALSFVSSIFLFGSSARAQVLSEDIGFRKIVGIGCHNIDGTCFVTVDGAVFGASLGCASGATTSFRFDNGDTAIGKRTFAALMAAYLSGKHVEVYLTGCSVQGFPAIKYFNIAD
jgi:hypothetical protein